jgi:hypothetical protein
MGETCPKCGAERKPGETECFQCGVIFEKYSEFLRQKAHMPTPETADWGTAAAAPAAPENSPLAIWSLVLGLLSPLCCGFLSAIPAIILGHMARSRIRESNGQLKGDGMALAGLILGYVSIVLFIILFFVGVMSSLVEIISQEGLLR